MTATYYNDLLKGTVLDVLKQNENGTVDLGLAGQLIVRECKLVSKPAPGTAMLDSIPAKDVVSANAAVIVQEPMLPSPAMQVDDSAPVSRRASTKSEPKTK